MNVKGLDKIESTYLLAEQIIKDLSDEAVNELLQGYDNDVQRIFDTIANEAYFVLYGTNQHIVTPSSFEYLEKLTKSVDHTLSCEIFNYFLTSVLKEFEINWHHLEWGDIVQHYSKFCIIAARDHGKTYELGTAYPVWKAYRYKKRGIDVRYDYTLSFKGIIYSFTRGMSMKILQGIKEMIESNEILAETLLPESTSEGWTKTTIRCKNGAIIEAKGFGTFTRGEHPGWALCDDVLQDNVMYSAEQRNKNIEYFRSVLVPMIVPGGQFGVIGTPFHQNDLYGYLKGTGVWHVREYPAVFPNGQLLWEGRYNGERLKERKVELGTLTFTREYLCRAVNNESTIFPYEILQKSIFKMEHVSFVQARDNYPIAINRVVVGCDFAISARAEADYSVFSVFGVDDNEVMYLMHLQRFKGKTYGEQMQILRIINHRFRPDIMFLEKNQFQEIFSQEAIKEGLPVHPHTTGQNKHDLKVGLPSLALLYENGKIKLPYQTEVDKATVDTIFAEHMSFAFTDKGIQSADDHDDIVMSFWLSSLAMRYQGNNFFYDFA